MRRPTIALALACTAALAGCKREPDFAERYDAASRQLDAKAKEIDAQLAERARAAEADAEQPSPSSADD